MSSKKKKSFHQKASSTDQPIPSAKPSTAIVAPKKEDKPDHPLEKVLNTFLKDLKAVQKTYQIVMPHVITWLVDQRKKHQAKLESFQIEADADGNEFYKTTDVHSTADLLSAMREMESLGGIKIPETLQRSLFTQIFCEFDSFIGALLKAVYANKADLLKSITREISFADLIGYESLNAIKLDMLNKEVESFRRESYVEQFSILENKFGLKTLRSFDEWGEFVELSQRRNLLVHNGGRVSEQYLVVCDREGYKFEKRPALGDLLQNSGAYFSRAIVVMSKVAFMLTHTLWRKLFPEQIEQAHDSANATLYELLKDKRWKSSAEIAKFCLCDQMKREITDLDLRLRIVNAAIAAKFSGSEDVSRTYLNSIDWSASYRDFKLALAVLDDKFQEAAALMKLIGKSGELVGQLNYHEWPLFHKFRETQEFLDAYQEIYQISFIKEAVRKSAEDAQQQNVQSENLKQVEDVTDKRETL